MSDTPAPARLRSTSYRLGKDTLGQIEEIAAALPDRLGRPLPQTDVVREAVRRLHAELCAPAPGPKKAGRKNSDKSP